LEDVEDTELDLETESKRGNSNEDEDEDEDERDEEDDEDKSEGDDEDEEEKSEDTDDDDEKIDEGLFEEERAAQSEEFGKRMKVLLSQFTPEQMDRYEVYRRSSFPKAAIKRLMAQISGSTVSLPSVIVMSGITKIFVGELVETARSIMEEWGDTGAIRPEHLREAYRRLKASNSNQISSAKFNKKLFKR
jgi:transcription initiation factor TFIID subunit 11